MGHIINLAVQAFLFRNDKDIEIFEEKDLESYDEIERSGEDFLSEAIAHKFRLLGPLGKLHNIITYSRSTPALQIEFKGWTDGKLVPLDNRTRWNSWHLCLVVALICMSAIDLFTKAHWKKLEKDFITPLEWERLFKIKEFLHPFKRATLATQGHKATLDRVLITMDILVIWFKQSIVRRFLSAPFKKRKS
jgi:hypothetical protein